jgi:formylglycine-generating enzyme required for sulfatase activity
MYGINNRMNCWNQTNTRWRADYVEYSFSNASLTDEIWPPDGANRAPRTLVVKAESLPPEANGLPVPAFTGKTISLDLAEGVAMKLVLIPAGKFIMGSAADEKGGSDNEGPQRVVTISKPFYMGVFEVTQEQWLAVMGKAAKARSPGHPVEQVDWTGATDFCKAFSRKTGKTLRLPTEAEWEYACRAGSATRYPFGDDEKRLDEYGWFIRNFKRTATAGHDGNPSPAGQKKPNAWGLYDMNGNVWEWCSDWYADSFAGAEQIDPKGPASGECHVLRGGSWSCLPTECRSASRWIGSPGDTQDTGTVGFRVVCEDAGKP